MHLFPLKSRLLQPGDSLLERLVESLARMRLRIRNGDIIAVASKVVSVTEKNILPLKRVEPSVLAGKLGRKFNLPPDFVQVVLDQADDVCGGVSGVLLTIKNGDATANSGVDRKNAPPRTVIPWPMSPHQSAEDFRRAIDQKLGKKIGVVIVDSRVTPLRLGTVGLAIACSGFQPVRDERGLKDLYGRRVSITFHALADGIAAAAQLLMGETREGVPFVLVRDAPVKLVDNDQSMRMTLPVVDCLYMSQIQPMSRTRAR